MDIPARDSKTPPPAKLLLRKLLADRDMYAATTMPIGFLYSTKSELFIPLYVF